MPSITVRPIDPRRDARWDAYVLAQPSSHVYQRAAWAGILQSAFGFRPACLAAFSASGELAGVLPAMVTRGVVTGRRQRSLPTVPNGGPVADGPAERRALLEAACDLAQRHRRNLTVSSPHDLDGLDRRLAPAHTAPTWITPLPDNPDELRAGWRRGSKNLHRNLNKAAKAGLTIRESSDDADLRAFYDLYLDTMRRHRALPRSLRFLRLAARALRADGTWRMWVVEAGGQVVAGGIFLVHGDTVELLYNASSPAALDLRPNHAVYWHVVQWAIEQRHRRLDWGRAEPDSSLGRFKRQWSAEPAPQHRYHYVVTPSGERALSLRDAGARLADDEEAGESLPGRVWAQVPLPLTRLAGDLVHRIL